MALTHYGAWTELDGARGLLLLPNLTWGRVTSVSDHIAVGDVIDAVVLMVVPEKGVVRLGIRELTPDPMLSMRVGDRHPGRVTSVADYGLFVELAGGLEGLLHVDALQTHHEFRTQPSDVAKPGDVVEVAIRRVVLDERRIDLTLLHR